MSESRSSRPALVPALALAGGLAAGPLLAPPYPSAWVPAVLAPLLALVPGTGRQLRATLLALGALCFGLGWGAAREARSAAAGERTLPASGLAVEVEIVGTVVALPEPSWDGGWIVAVRAESIGGCPSGHAAPWIRLSVGAGGTARAGVLDRLRTGDCVRIWARVIRPRGHRNDRIEVPLRGLRAAGWDALGSVKNPLLIERLRVGPRRARRGIDDVKRWARGRLDRVLGSSGDVRALAGAVLLGDRAAMRPEQVRRLRRAGLVHLVAISGLHVGMVAAALYALLRRSRIPPGAAAAIGLVALVAFALGVGPRPPVVRAAAACGLLAVGRALGRDACPSNTLALVGASMLLARPSLALDPGFRLTVLATAGILLHAAPLAGRLPGPRAIRLALAVSLTAYGAAAPVVAWHFGVLAPGAPLVNLAAAPCCAVLLLCGYGSLACAPFPWVGDGLGRLAGCAAAGIDRVASLADGAVPGPIPVPQPDPGWVALYYAAFVLAGARATRRRTGVRRLAACALAIAVVWLHTGPPPRAPRDDLEVSVIDVGQGQSVLLREAAGRGVLVDTGGSARAQYDPGERIVLPFLVGRGVRRLDALLVSHGDVDHAGGAPALLADLDIGELWLPPGFPRDVRLARLARLARRRGVALVLAEAGHAAFPDSVALRVLAPHRGDRFRSSNDGSLVVLAGRPPGRVLIPGDLERSGEAALLARGAGVRAEVLVAAHHGARNASGAAFLRAVRPRLVVVSCGYRNRFGHPHPETLARIEAIGARVMRTDLQGLVELEIGAAGRPRLRAVTAR